MFIQSFIDFMVTFATDFLMPLMFGLFFLGITCRLLIWWTVKREYWFSSEFEKRIQRYINSVERTDNLSFFVITKRLLEITFYELFEVRSIMKRRNPDVVMAAADRVFLIQQGSARIVNDVLRKTRYVKFEHENPKFVNLSKSVFQNNPCFNRLFGVVPISGINDFISILPNIFIVLGIFGTFLAIMRALPELGGMDVSDVDGTKAIMDAFLLKISFSMSTSILGIVLSICTTFINTFFSGEKQFVATVDTFTESLNTLWSISSNNNLPDELELEENEDPLEVLAEDVVARELKVSSGFVKLARPVQGWWLKERAKKPDAPIIKTSEVESREEVQKQQEEKQEQKQEEVVNQEQEDINNINNKDKAA